MTQFQEVFDKALDIITKRDLVLKYTENELYQKLKTKLERVIWSMNPPSEVDLTDCADTCFNNEVGEDAQWILAYGISFCFFEDCVYNFDLIKTNMTLKDWNSPSSPAKLMDTILKSAEWAENKYKSKKVKYGWTRKMKESRE